MKKMLNKAHLEGRISEHSLELRTSKSGVPYIGGKIMVATDDKGINVVPVEIIYVTEKSKNGSTNKTFEALSVIMNRGKTILMDGLENATIVRIDSSISLNEWYRDENGQKSLVSTKRISGGFVHIENELKSDETTRNTFEAEMVITNTVLMEANEDYGTPEKLIVKGSVFDFAGRMLPVEFSVVNPNGIKYFENSLDVTPNTPVFTKVWGRLVNEVIKTTIVEESAFGDSSVREVEKTKRDWVITGMSKEAMEFDSEDTITAKELHEAIANRNIHLSDLLQSQIERENAKKNKDNAFNAGAKPAAPAPGGFTF